MPKLHELSWDEIRGHLHAIAEGHSGAVVGEMREKLLAQALQEPPKSLRPTSSIPISLNESRN
jgi:hypothetical protein